MTRQPPDAALRCRALVAGALLALLCAGCARLANYTDRDVAQVIRERQRAALGLTAPAEPVTQSDRGARLDRGARDPLPNPQNAQTPPDFEEPATAPAVFDAAVSVGPTSAPASAASGGADEPPRRLRQSVFTLTDALEYAQHSRREYQTAKEDLYLAALRLTVERHLWTPQFAAELRTVYGNYGEAQNFDQAMRFVSDLSVTQRLPYGGRFTAQAIATLIRDVGQSITAAEGSTLQMGLEIPLLRGAGHVAREQLTQLERALTYAVRDFERFRRRQLVLVARSYFGLLRSKQSVLDAIDSLKRAADDFERAQALERANLAGEAASPLDTRRAEQRMLSEQNRLAELYESFRLSTDEFKLVLGMPVDEGIGLEDLEDIDSIERRVNAGEYPLLRRPRAAQDEPLALSVALARRLDLLSRADQIDDARRGAKIAANALLPDLGWNTSGSFDTDPNHFNSGAHEWQRGVWRSEVVLSMTDRFRERTEYRAAQIDVTRAQRSAVELREQVRVEVRRAVNQLRLQERLMEIQKRNVEVADLRREYARIRFLDGDLGNRDLVEAEDEWVRARNGLNQAKTERWSVLLEFRLVTETLRVDEQGVQYTDSQAG